tara:strand:- start:250 stop:1122 length:873 start_codon:yes stop_codon:yes gene_type:complete
MLKKIHSGFTLIEILVVTIIIGILSSAGVVAFKEVTSTAKEKTAYSNYKQVVKSMESEFTKCKLDKSSRIFNSHSCNSSGNPSTNTINNYINNNLKLKNPYNKNQPIAQSNVCTAGAISISNAKTGSYNVSHVSIKKKTKSTTLVSSKWSSNYSNSKTTKISFSCGSSGSKSKTASKGTFENYESPKNLPRNGLGAWIEVDRNGNMTSGYGGGMVCESSYCGSQNAKNKQGRYRWLKSGYKVVFVSPASASGNVSSVCARRGCKYNFSNNTYTHISTGTVYDPLTGKPKK